MVPGNHDGQFKDSKPTRMKIIESIRSDQKMSYEDDYINTCAEPLADYFDFQNRISTPGQIFSDKLWSEYRFSIADKVIRFSAINASWMSTVPELPGTLIFPVEKYAQQQEDVGAINILLIHHPLNWYAQSTYHPLRAMAKVNYQFVMSGHEHTGIEQEVRDFQGNALMMFEAPALSSKGTSKFSVLLIDLEQECVAVESFSWDNSAYRTDSGSAYWNVPQKIPQKKQKNGFHLTAEAKDRLESLDASFHHPRKEHIQLSDVFIYPDMQDLDPDVGPTEIVSSDTLLSRDNEAGKKVFIYGDEQFGKSSLLKHLFMEFFRSGLIPLLFDANDATSTPEHFLRMLDRKVEEFYGPEARTKFAQTAKSVKIALVDNAEKIARGDTLARALRNIDGQFGAVIVVAGERYEVTVLSSVEATEALHEYSTFKMLGFGFKLRHSLIKRWYEVGRDFDEAELQSRVHRAEIVINGVLGKGLAPMTAFNTLVLLQTIEVNEKGSLANAGMAQYYEYMFRQSLVASKVKTDELDEIQSYLIHFAWYMYEKGTEVLTEEDFIEFNSWFSKNMFKTSFVARVDLLKRAKIINEKAEGFSFAYAYLNYFFVAKYLASYCEDRVELKDLIRHMCRHLYLRDNANIVLFLTHHLQSNWIIQEISDLLNEILAGVSPLRLEDGATTLNKWVNEHAKIVIDTSNIAHNNKKLRETEDAVATRSEKQPDAEVSSIHELDQITQLNLLFKTSEILGQVLKGRYGSILKEVKNDLVKRIFDAPLRGVNFFIEMVDSEPDGLVLDVAKKIEMANPNLPKEKLDLLAKRYIFNAVGNVADSFVTRQGEIIGTPKLVDTLDAVAAGGSGVSYEMMAIASKLSYPNNPPIDQIKLLSDKLDSNFFAKRLLQGLVARHLYMFSLSTPDRNRLASSVGIRVQEQREIELNSHAQRKLPTKADGQPRNAKSLISRLQSSFMVRNKGVMDRVIENAKKKRTSEDEKK